MISYQSAFLYAGFLHGDDDPVLDTPLWQLAEDAEDDSGDDWMSREATPPSTPPPSVELPPGSDSDTGYDDSREAGDDGGGGSGGFDDPEQRQLSRGQPNAAQHHRTGAPPRYYSTERRSPGGDTVGHVPAPENASSPGSPAAGGWDHGSGGATPGEAHGARTQELGQALEKSEEPVPDWFEERFGLGAGAGRGGTRGEAGDGDPASPGGGDGRGGPGSGWGGVDPAAAGPGSSSFYDIYGATDDGRTRHCPQPHQPPLPPWTDGGDGPSHAGNGEDQREAGPGTPAPSSHGGEREAGTDGDADARAPPPSGAEEHGPRGSRGASAGRSPRRNRRFLELEVFCEDEGGEEMIIPPVRLDLRTAARGASGGRSREPGSRLLGMGSREAGSGKAGTGDGSGVRQAWGALKRIYSLVRDGGDDGVEKGGE